MKSTKIFWLKVVLCLAFFFGFFLSPHLWTSARFYPMTPVISFLPMIPFPIDRLIFSFVLILLILILFIPKPTLFCVTFVLLAGILSLFDQSRWQPWFYQYLFMMIALCFYPWRGEDRKKEDAILTICRVIIVSVYFWSGIQKINPVFFESVFPNFVNPLTRLFPIIGNTPAMAIPLLEIGIAFGLVIEKFRRAAVIFASIMHGVILFSLGPFGNNSNNVVWPWNISMIFFVFILFWQTKSPFRVFQIRGMLPLSYTIILLFCILPLFSLFNLWDSYLSASLYSGNYHWAYIYVTDEVKKQLPKDVRINFTEAKEDKNRASIHSWSFRELNVPAYPEIRIYKNITRYICSFAENPIDVVLVINKRRTLIDLLNWQRKVQKIRYNCSAI
jgi:uncharacterized membrane protein YphA (DoxX/SURF4 family)